MRCTHCGMCCQETDMLLSTQDISRLESEGYNKAAFVRFDKDGYALLRNYQGHCVFYFEKTHSCKVYSFRPSGCRVYPVIYDDETGVIVDKICEARDTISKSEKIREGKNVIRLLKIIDKEAQLRRSS